MAVVVKYVLELGVDTADRGRVCALEVGSFFDPKSAEEFAESVRGVSILSAERAAYSDGLMCDSYDREDGDFRFPIAGATLNAYTDDYGTDYDRSRNLY